MDLTREHLHRLVWAHPAQAVADALGISSSLLSRVCRRFDIETPGRGYWRRRETGKVVSAAKTLDGLHDVVVRLNVPDNLVQTIEARAVRCARKKAELAPAADRPSAARASGRHHTPSGCLLEQVDGPQQGCSRIDGVSGNIDLTPPPDAALLPTAANLCTLSERWHDYVRVMQFIEALRDAAKGTTPGHAAVLHLWLAKALKAWEGGGPIAEVQDYCRRAAQAGSQPPWFES